MPDGPVAGRLDAEIQLARLADVAGLDDDRLEGLLDAGLSLGGTLQDPQLDGTVEIIDGIYENGLTGTVLHDMTLRARARQQRLTIEELSANDGGSGRITGQGFVEIDPAASFPLDADPVAAERPAGADQRGRRHARRPAAAGGQRRWRRA